MVKTKSVYDDRLKNVKEAHEKVYKKSTDSSSMPYKIGNYEKRLSSVGIDTKEATDKRNWFEKLTNLPEDQNALFDAFELIGRPQQALFGAIEAAQNGDSILEGAKQGITGEGYTYGGDILRNFGVNDDKIFNMPFTGQDISLADMLGFGADLFADPIDLALWASVPVTGGATAPVAAAKTLDNAADVGRVTNKTLKALDTASDVAKTVDTVADAAKTAEKTRIALRPFQKGSKSTLELLMGGAAKGTKKLAKVADVGISAGLNKFDYNNIAKLAEDAGIIKKGEKVVKSNVDDIITKLDAMGIKSSSALDTYKAAKKGVERTFDYAKSIPDNLYKKVKRSDNVADTVNAYGKQIIASNKSKIDNYAKAVGKDADEVDRAINILVEQKYTPQQGFGEFVREAAKKGKAEFTGNDDVVKDVASKINEFKASNDITDDMLNVIISDGKLKITVKGKQASKDLKILLQNEGLMNKLDNIKITRNVKDTLDADTLAEIANLESTYGNDKAFKQLLSEVEDSYNQFNNYLISATNGKINFGDILREGYTRTALTDDGKVLFNLLKKNGINMNDELLKGNKQTFRGKKHSNVTEQAEKEVKGKIASKIESKEKSIETLKNVRHENKVAKQKEALKEIEAKRAELKAKEKESLAILEKSKKAKQIDKQIKDTNIQDIKDIVTDKVIEKSKNINNVKSVEDLSVKATKYNNKVEKYNKLINDYEKFKLEVTDLEKAQKKLQSFDRKIAKAKENMIKAEVDLRVQVGKVMTGAEEKFITRAGKLAESSLDKMESAVKAQRKAAQNLEKTMQKIQDTKQYYEDIAIRLEKQQKTETLKLKNLLAKSPEDIEKYNKYIDDKIVSLQKEIDLLKSAEGVQLFSTSFNKGFESFINEATSATKAMTAYNEVLLHSGLKDTRVMEFVAKGDKPIESVGKVRLTPEQLSNIYDKLDEFKNLMPEDSKLIKEFKESVSGSKEVWIDRGAYELLTLGNAKKDANIVLGVVDRINNFFKKTSTVSPGTQVRNAMGNCTNMWLSGIPAPDIAKSYAKATKLSKSDYIIDLITKEGAGTLTKSEAKDLRVVKQFIESGAFGTGKDIRDLGNLIEEASKSKNSKNLLKKAWDGIFSTSAKLNQGVDNLSRMALLSYADRTPAYVSKLGVKDAIEAMHYTLFDAQNLSSFEKDVLKRIIPFYTFQKQNLMFQMKNITNNTTKYKRLIKTFNEMYDGVGEDNYRQYQKENFEIPIVTDDGTLSVKANLPLSDLGEYASNPLQRIVAGTSPLIKAPFELTSGVDSFTGQDISDRSPLESLIKYAGLQNGQKFVSGVGDLINGESQSTVASVLPSVFRYTDPEKIANQRQYEQLMEYQNLVKNLKNNGVEVPTMSELKAYQKFDENKVDYNKLTDKQKENYKAYQEYLLYVQSLRNQGVDIPQISELTNSTSSLIKAVQKRRDSYNKRRSS